MKPRMLFVSPEFPWPATSGGRLRTLSLLRCLGTRFEIHCVTFTEKDSTPPDAGGLRSSVARLTVVPLTPHRQTTLSRYARNMRRALQFAHPFVDRYSEPEARRAVCRLVNQEREWIWFEHVWVAPYVTGRGQGATTILDVHNVESAFYRQLRRTTRNPLERVGFRVFQQAARKIERQFVPCFDRVLAVSEEERQLLARDGVAGKIFVVPNAVQPVSLQPDSGGDHRTLYFAGRLDYPPNRQAILWFCKRVWPLIQSRVPNARCQVLGVCPERLGVELRRSPNMIVAGQVETIEPFVAQSSVAIVPVLSGGGTRFKVLDAWAAGKAVVSTTTGAEGLAARHGENIWLADEPQEFADSVVRLLKDPELRAVLGRNGRKTVEERYSLERLQESLDAALLGARGAPAEQGCA